MTHCSMAGNQFFILSGWPKGNKFQTFTLSPIIIAKSMPKSIPQHFDNRQRYIMRFQALYLYLGNYYIKLYLNFYFGVYEPIYRYNIYIIC